MFIETSCIFCYVELTPEVCTGLSDKPHTVKHLFYIPPVLVVWRVVRSIWHCQPSIQLIPGFLCPEIRSERQAPPLFHLLPDLRTCGALPPLLNTFWWCAWQSDSQFTTQDVFPFITKHFISNYVYILSGKSTCWCPNSSGQLERVDPVTWLIQYSGWLPDDLGCTCLTYMKHGRRKQDEEEVMACTLFLQTALVWQRLGSRCSHRRAAPGAFSYCSAS
jgi:hypothetical protein